MLASELSHVQPKVHNLASLYTTMTTAHEYGTLNERTDNWSRLEHMLQQLPRSESSLPCPATVTSCLRTCPTGIRNGGHVACVSMARAIVPKPQTWSNNSCRLVSSDDMRRNPTTQARMPFGFNYNCQK